MTGRPDGPTIAIVRRNYATATATGLAVGDHVAWIGDGQNAFNRLAAEVIREVVTNPGSRYKLTTDALRSGDIERALMEWRSLLRHIAAAPDLEWDRWRALQAAAADLLKRTASPTTFDFPPLLAAQRRRMEG